MASRRICRLRGGPWGPRRDLHAAGALFRCQTQRIITQGLGQRKYENGRPRYLAGVRRAASRSPSVDRRPVTAGSPAHLYVVNKSRVRRRNNLRPVIVVTKEG